MNLSLSITGNNERKEKHEHGSIGIPQEIG
jgi:hypothetical protein